jgi:glycosyltransferase involved in cell wall biosynthesis
VIIYASVFPRIKGVFNGSCMRLYWVIQVLLAHSSSLTYFFPKIYLLKKPIKSEFTSNSLVTEGRKGLRICFISSYPPNHARLSEYAKNLVAELANKPTIDQMNVLTDQISSSNGDLPEDPKVKVVRVWKQDNPLSILGVMVQVLKLKPDVVHFSIGYQSFGKSRISNFTGISLVFLCRLCGLKVIVLLHNLAELVDLEKVKQKQSFTNKAGIMVATRLILSASRVVVMVKSYKDYLKKHYKNKGILFIPHGNLSHNCESINPEDKVVLIFGHMGPFKGLPIMLRAFEKITRERNDVQLVIAGANHPNFPTYLDEFVKKAPPKVVFTGYVPEKDLCKVFGMADVVVTPYLLATGTSGVFHLACGFGKPIVSSNLPEIRELLSDGATALLVSPGDAEALKDAILKVLNNKEVANKMAEQNLRFAHKERLSIVAKIYEETYLELLKT